MYLHSTLVVGIVSNVLSLIGIAQPIPPPASRFTVGLTGTYARYNTPSRYIPTIIAGLQLTPRLAMQLGVGYTWRKYKYGNGTERYFDSQTNEFHNEVTHTSYSRLLTVPVLVRYSVTPLTKRLHLDVLGGATALYYLGRYDETFSTATQPRQTITKDSYDHFAGLFSAGLGLRYTLTSRLELVGDALINTTWPGSYYDSYERYYPSSFSIGARYHFKAQK